MGIRSIFYVICILTFGCRKVNAACDEATKPTIESSNGVFIKEGHIAVYKCEANHRPPDAGHRVIVSKCYDNSWSNITAGCVADPNYVAPSCPTTFDVPDALAFHQDGGYYILLHCVEGKDWLSGEKYRLMECLQQTNTGLDVWSDIPDMCAEPCEVPRDCDDIEDLGLDEAGTYRVIPSGAINGDMHEITCQLDSTDWTTIASFTSSSHSHTLDEYIDGFIDDPNNYFVGLDYLKERSVGEQLTVKYEVKADGITYTLICNDFSISSGPDYQIESLGNCHSNEGDTQCPLLGTSFEHNGEIGSWGSTDVDNIALANANSPFLMFNGNLNETTITSSKMSIITTDVDKETNCSPTGLIYNPLWKDHTTSNLSGDRSQGTTYTWNCEQEYYMAGPDENDEYSSSGQTECSLNDNNELEWTVPQWYLPCQLVCPDGFVESLDGTRCYYFSTDQADGIEEAAAKCLAMNATLAAVPNEEDIVIQGGTTYMIGSSQRGTSQGTVEPEPYPNGYTCGSADSCAISQPSLSCIAVDTQANYEVVNCSLTSNYICEVSGKCPEDFVEFKGLCHKEAVAANIFSAQQYCESIGASLYYPTSQAHLDAVLAVVNGSFVTGLNSLDSSWGGGGHYSNSDLTLTMDANSPYVMFSYDDATAIASLQNVDLTATENQKYHCQYWGPIGCKEPPPLLDFATWTWDNAEMFAVAAYECDRGYFVGGNIQQKNQAMECLSHFKGWVPIEYRNGGGSLDILDCVHVPVCEGWTISHESTTVTNYDDSNYLDGNMTFECLDSLWMDVDGTLTRSVYVQCLQLETAGSFGFNITDADCNICVGDVLWENADSNYDESARYQISDKLTITCSGGYEHSLFENETTVECKADIGWDESPLQECHKVCNPDLITLDESLTLEDITNNRIGAKVIAECEQSGYFLKNSESNPEVRTFVTYECMETQQWSADWTTENIYCVNACSEDPPVECTGCTSSWDTYNREVEHVVNYTCDTPDFYFTGMTTFVETTCDGTAETNSWTPLTSPLECEKGCDPTIAAEPDATVTEITSNFVGETYVVECDEGMYFRRTENLPLIANTSVHECNESSVWEADRPIENLVCEAMCVEDPPIASEDHITIDWDGYTTTIDTTVNFTCDGGYTFEDKSTEVIYTCTDGGIWTSSNPALDNILCGRICETSDLVISANASINAPEDLYFSGNVLVENCTEGYGNLPSKKTTNNITCGVEGTWEYEDEEFECEPLCFDEPPEIGESISNYSNSNPEHSKEGTSVAYNCSGGYWTSGDELFILNCTNGKWSPDTLPFCMPATTPTTQQTTSELLVIETTTEVQTVTVDTDLYAFDYKKTATSYIEDPTEFKSINGEEIASTVSKVGLKEAGDFYSSKNNCALMEEFVREGCLDGENGFTFGLWLAPRYTQEEKDSRENGLKLPPKTIAWNGGNMYGQPGFHLYLQGTYCCVMYSLGERYYDLCVFGHLINDTWSHVAFTYSNNEVILYKNGEQVGGTKKTYPQKGTETPDPGLSGNLYVGCMLSGDVSTAYMDAKADAVVLWCPSLPDNNETLQKTLMAGLVKDDSEYNSADLSKIVKDIKNLNNKELYAGTAKFAEVVADKTLNELNLEEEEETEPDPGDPDYDPAEEPTISIADQKSAQGVENLYDVYYKLLDPKAIKTTIGADECKAKTHTAFQVRNLLKPEMNKYFDAIAGENHKIKGPTKIFDRQIEFFKVLYSRCNFEDVGMHCEHFEYLDEGIVADLCSTTIGELKKNPTFELPKYQGQEFKDKWKDPYARVMFSTDCFKDERCNNRRVGIVAISFMELHKVFPTDTQEGSLPQPPKWLIDSRIITFEMMADKEKLTPKMRQEMTECQNVKSGEEGSECSHDTATHLCETDDQCMRYKPLRIIVENEVQSQPHFHLNWLEDESLIRERVCVKWNPLAKAVGAWTNLTSKLLKTTEEYTICQNTEFGTFALLKTVYKEPDEVVYPDWLTILSYIAFGISALLLGLYIAVVVISEELKDQFHLLGMFLAIMILLGMVTRFLEQILTFEGKDRARCVAFNMLWHFFGLSTGVWMCAVAHASFRAVTAGVISGKLKPYVIMSLGMSLAIMSAPFIGFGDQLCSIWASSYWLLTFHVPQICFVLASIFFSFVIFCNMSAPALRKDNLIEDYGSFAKGSALLQIYFSIVFVFHLMTFPEIEKNLDGINFYPASLILFFFLGTALFIFIGLGSTRFRLVLIGQYQKKRQKMRGYRNRTIMKDPNRRTLKPGYID